MTAPRSAHRSRRPVGVAIGLFALLLQLLLPLGLAVASDGYELNSKPFGLCLSDDGRRLFLGFDDPAEQNRSYECPLCITFKDLSLAPPDGSLEPVSIPYARAHRYVPQADAGSIAQQTPRQQSIRGPPSA